MSVHSLRHLVDPKAIVWIGPDGPAPDWAMQVETNLFNSGFAGRVLAIGSIGPAPEHARRADPGALDCGPFLAVVCLPQPDPITLLEQLAEASCRAMVLVGGPLSQASISPERAAALVAAGRQRDIRIIGPDRIGVVVPGKGLNAGALVQMPAAGDIAFVTQSDTIATAMVDWAIDHRVGFSKLVSLGDSCDVEVGDVLDYLGIDLGTRAVLLYLEGIADPRRFVSAARSTSRAKPIIVVKAGRDTGRENALVDEDAVYEAALKRAGVLRYRTIQDLFRGAESLAAGLAKGGASVREGRLAIISNGRGTATMAVDALRRGGGHLAELDETARAALAACLPLTVAATNPLDLGFEATADIYADSIKALSKAACADGLLVIHSPAAGVDGLNVAHRLIDIVGKQPRSMPRRPILAAWPGAHMARVARRALTSKLVPTYETPEAAVQAFLNRVTYERRQALLSQIPSSQPTDFAFDRERATTVIEAALAAGRRQLSEPEALDVLAAYGIASAPARLARDVEGAVEGAAEIDFPVALKLVVPGVTQKRRIGAVALDVKDPADLRRRAERMRLRLDSMVPGSAIEGYLVQKVVRGVNMTELVVGFDVDPSFGPVIFVGQSGEGDALVDAGYALPPLNADLARSLLEDSGAGRAALAREESLSPHRAGLVDVLRRLSQLTLDQPALQRLIIEPLLALPDGTIAIDAEASIAPWPADRHPSSRFAVHPYPKELEEEVVLKDGRRLLMRPIRPEDAEPLQRFFSHLDPEDLRRRFLAPMKEVSDALAARLSQIDYDREMCVLIVDPTKPDEIWAGARVAMEPDGQSAEFSVTVRTDRQGLGLGHRALGRVLDYARERGVREVWGSVLHDNKGMLGLARRLGFVSHIDPDDAALVKSVIRFDS
ncbi:MAG: GNAT family N-acetyltransferase [Geminicoccaceae bacterium]